MSKMLKDDRGSVGIALVVFVLALAVGFFLYCVGVGLVGALILDMPFSDAFSAAVDRPWHTLLMMLLTGSYYGFWARRVR